MMGHMFKYELLGNT